MPADRPRIADLRKLAREALSAGAVVWEGTDSVSPRMCEALTSGESIVARAATVYEARRQLRELLTLVVMGRKLMGDERSAPRSRGQLLESGRFVGAAERENGGG